MPRQIFVLYYYLLAAVVKKLELYAGSMPHLASAVKHRVRYIRRPLRNKNDSRRCKRIQNLPIMMLSYLTLSFNGIGKHVLHSAFLVMQIEISVFPILLNRRNRRNVDTRSHQLFIRQFSHSTTPPKKSFFTILLVAIYIVIQNKKNYNIYS